MPNFKGLKIIFINNFSRPFLYLRMQFIYLFGEAQKYFLFNKNFITRKKISYLFIVDSISDIILLMCIEMRSLL